MSTELLYLRPDIQVEPLFDSWYAWSYLIPPATAARNITERHLRIMESYISAPEAHAAAVQNPRMLGGPFIDQDIGSLDDIVTLQQRTKRDRADLIELSSAIQALDSMLLAKAKGYSLEELYSEVPGILKGYVELVYDLANNASFRIIEPLLYRSKYYQPDAQSLRLSISNGDDRPFVLSTPRLDSAESVNLAIPFNSEIVDWLFRLKRSPCVWNDVLHNLLVPKEKLPLLASFFSAEPPNPYERYKGSGVRWRYFGHACILVESKDISILFDPVLSYTYESESSRYTYEDLPNELDYVVFTHNHQDHVLFETVLQIRHKVRTFVVPHGGGGALQDPAMKLLLEQVGCKHVIELRELGSIDFLHGSITGLPFLGEHGDLDVKSKLGYLVRLGRHSLMFLADSCNIEPVLYEHLHREVGDVDALFIGMECDGAPMSWLYGPLVTRKMPRAMDTSRRLAGSNYKEATDIVARFEFKEVYVYAMGQEPWLNHVMSIKYTGDSRPIVDSNRLISECQSRGVIAERLFGEKEILLEE